MVKEKRQQKRGRGKSRHQPVGGAETMADGEREGGNKVERGRATSAGQMGRGWTQSSSASIPVQYKPVHHAATCAARC